jgi:hypothetical protein
MPRSHLVSIRTVSAPALVTGDLRVIPEFQVLRVRLPFGGLIWSQPTAVVVESEVRGEGRRLAIVDVNAIARLLVVGCALAVAAGLSLGQSRKEQSRS